MSTGGWIWAAMMCALVAAYLVGLRADGQSSGKMVKIAFVWVAIIGGGYLLVSWITGMQ